MIPKLLLIDRDSVINHASCDPNSPLYYILSYDHMIIKPNVREACALLKILRKSFKFNIAMVTKQRCISKGIIPRDGVDSMNFTLQTDLHFCFDKMYVEEEAESKIGIIKQAMQDFQVSPEDTLLIDDSSGQCIDAAKLGCQTRESDDLYASVCRVFKIT